MSYYSDGFLSDFVKDVGHTVRDRYAEYREAYMRLNKECVAAQYELQIKLEQPRELLSAAFFIRTIASCQACIILLEHGLIAQAKTVLRSALESLFALAAIEAKPELALPIAQSQEADKRSLADKILQWKSPELKSSLAGRIEEAKLLELASNTAPEFNAWKLAEAAGMTDWYLSLYALLSFPVHATVSDLDSHLVKDSLGVITGLNNEPMVEGQEPTWVLAIQIQLRAAVSLTNIFGVKSIDIPLHEKALSEFNSRF